MFSYKSIYDYPNIASGVGGDRHRFRSVARSGFNVLDTPDSRFFKLLFYFQDKDSTINDQLIVTDKDDENKKTTVFDNTGSGLLVRDWPEQSYYVMPSEYPWHTSNSAYSYLMNNIEIERAEELKQFITLLSNISSESPWYFKEVAGVDEALGRENFKIDDERKKITITCMEDPIDHRISSLLSLYRSIVWSHAKKCEVLPANLRKFDMGLFVFSGLTMGPHAMPGTSDDPEKKGFKLAANTFEETGWKNVDVVENEVGPGIIPKDFMLDEAEIPDIDIELEEFEPIEDDLLIDEYVEEDDYFNEDDFDEDDYEDYDEEDYDDEDYDEDEEDDDPPIDPGDDPVDDDDDDPVDDDDDDPDQGDEDIDDEELPAGAPKPYGTSDFIPAVRMKGNAVNAASCKFIEFHNCEISLDSIKSGFGSLNNETGIQQEFKIDLYFDDCYEMEYNQFLLRSFGDLLLSDVGLIVDYDLDDINKENNEYGINPDHNVSKDSYYLGPWGMDEDTELEERLNPYKQTPVEDTEENVKNAKHKQSWKQKIGSEFKKMGRDVLGQAVATAKQTAKNVTMKALNVAGLGLGNLYNKGIVGNTLFDLKKQATSLANKVMGNVSDYTTKIINTVQNTAEDITKGATKTLMSYAESAVNVVDKTAGSALKSVGNIADMAEKKVVKPGVDKAVDVLTKPATSLGNLAGKAEEKINKWEQETISKMDRETELGNYIDDDYDESDRIVAYGHSEAVSLGNMYKAQTLANNL